MPAKTATPASIRKRKAARRGIETRKRMKLSTTVDAENFSFLESMVIAGRSSSIAEAVDMAVARLRRLEGRARLEAATAQYFEGLSAKAEQEENKFAQSLHLSSSGLDFDLEP